MNTGAHGRKHNTSTPFKGETVHEFILKPDLSRFCACFCIEESTHI